MSTKQATGLQKRKPFSAPLPPPSAPLPPQPQQQQQPPPKELPPSLYERVLLPRSPDASLSLLNKQDDAVVQTPLDDLPGYWALNSVFFTATNMCFGLTSICMGVHLKVVLPRVGLTWLLIGQLLILYLVMIPAFETTCCIRPGLSRDDLGHCNDPHSKIFKEPVGWGLKTVCGSFGLDVKVMIASCVVSAALIFVLLLWEYGHPRYEHHRAAKEAEARVRPFLPLTHEEREPYREAVIYAVNTVATVRSETVDWLVLLTHLYPETFVYGAALRTFGHRVLAKFVILCSVVAVVLFIVIYVEEQLYQAWGRCYPPGTSIYGLTNGMCTKTVYPRKSWWGPLVAAFAADLLVSASLVTYSAVASYEHRARAITHIEELRIDENSKRELQDFVKREPGVGKFLPELEEEAQKLLELGTPASKE